MLYIRSSIFLIVFLLIILIASLTTLICGWLFPLKKRVRITHATEKAITLALRLIGNIGVEIDYADKSSFTKVVQEKRPLLIVSNHQSRWETFYLQSLFPPLINVLKHELLAIPIAGWALGCYWPVAVRRSKAIASIKKVEREGKLRLAAGFNLLVFPQATRLPPGKTGHIGAGAARLGVQSGAILVPVAHNAGQHWPKNSFSLAPGTIHIHLGAPIDCSNKSTQEIAQYYRDFFVQHLSRQKPLSEHLA